MLQLSPMSDADFQMYLRRAIPQYAYDQTRSGNWHASEAAARAQQEFQSLLPDGPQSPNHHFFTILDADGRKVGMAWFVLDQGRARPTAFLADLFIFSEFRSRSYGGEALSLLEARASSLGAQRMDVQVFGHDQDARQLYEQNGFGLVSAYLGKDLTG